MRAYDLHRKSYPRVQVIEILILLDDLVVSLLDPVNWALMLRQPQSPVLPVEYIHRQWDNQWFELVVYHPYSHWMSLVLHEQRLIPMQYLPW